MNMDKEQKAGIVKKYGRQEKDTGSPESQIALLSKKITELTDHLRYHRKDHSSRRGLLTMVSKRRHLLDYLKKRNYEKYQEIVKEFKIRHGR